MSRIIASMRYILCLSALATLCMLAGCNAHRQHKTESIADYNLNTSFEECKRSASDMNDGPKNSNNPLWTSYFEMCMSSKGYTRSDYKHFWY